MLQTTLLRRSIGVAVHSPAVTILAKHAMRAGVAYYHNNHQLKGNNQTLMSQRRNFVSGTLMSGSLAVGALASISSAMYVAFRYKVAQPNEYIVKTGPFVTDVDISRRTLILPFQEYDRIIMSPFTIKTVVNAMTTEKIPFNMPMTFTICPLDSAEHLKKYSGRMCGISDHDREETLLGIIQGNARVLTAEMELEKLFNDRDNFKTIITDNINNSLEDFGLKAVNVNIEELVDNDGSEYFKYMKKKALEKAVNKARVDVAEQTKEGDIGEKEHIRTSRKKLAEIEADAVNTENEKQREMLSSTTDLEIAKSNFEKSRHIAAYMAKAEAEMRQIELQQSVEEKRKNQLVEEKRATDFSAALVAAEVKAKEMEGVMTAQKHKADAEAHIAVVQAKAHMETQKLNAEAQLYQQQKVAEALLYEEQKKAEAYLLSRTAEANGIAVMKAAEAKGIEQVKAAEAKGLEQLVLASGGDPQALSRYLLITNGTIVDVAKEQANSLQNMKPTIWVNNTASGGGQGSLSDAMGDILRNAVPLNDAIRAQTGVDFLGSLNVKRDGEAPKDAEVTANR